MNTIYPNSIAEMVKNQRKKRLESKNKTEDVIEVAKDFKDLFFGEEALLGGKGRSA